MTDTTPTSDTSTAAGPALGRIVAGVLLTLVGVAWLLDAMGVTDVPWRALFPIALIAVGVGLVIGGLRGTLDAGLLVLGLVLAVASLLMTSIPSIDTVATGVGERRVQLDRIEDAQGYELGVGDLTVDLRAVELPGSGDLHTVTVEVGIGRAEILLPDDVGVEIHAEVGLGATRIGDRTREGAGIEVTERIGPEPIRLRVEVEVGIGEVIAR